MRNGYDFGSQKRSFSSTRAPPVRQVGVVGCGPSGLALLNACRNTPAIELTFFEKQATTGGMWNYDWRTGHDVHASMYERQSGPRASYKQRERERRKRKQHALSLSFCMHR